MDRLYCGLATSSEPQKAGMEESENFQTAVEDYFWKSLEPPDFYPLSSRVRTLREGTACTMQLLQDYWISCFNTMCARSCHRIRYMISTTFLQHE